MPTVARRCLLALACCLATVPVATAKQSVLDQLRDACESEVRDLCAHISPGNGRLIACLYANEDMVAPRCNFVLYQSAPQLGELIAAMTRMADACRADIDAQCQDFKGAQGGIAKCLELHRATLAPQCTQAIDALQATGNAPQ